MQKNCKIDGCAKGGRMRRGMCGSHYQRWQRHGDPMGGSTSMGEALTYYEDIVVHYDGLDCLIWPFSSEQGYGVLWFKGRTRSVSRIICELVNGPPPTPDHEAAHSCGNGRVGCVTRRHMVWKTHPENMQDTIEHGTSRRGHLNTMAKLTDGDVRLARSLHGIFTQAEIAEHLGVSAAHISRIQSRSVWAWLEDAA